MRSLGGSAPLRRKGLNRSASCSPQPQLRVPSSSGTSFPRSPAAAGGTLGIGATTGQAGIATNPPWQRLRGPCRAQRLGKEAGTCPSGILRAAGSQDRSSARSCHGLDVSVAVVSHPFASIVRCVESNVTRSGWVWCGGPGRDSWDSNPCVQSPSVSCA